MGSASSISNLEVAQPLGSEWVKESRENYCIVLRNVETGQQAQQYVVSSNQQIPQQFERYEYRLQQNENLVSTWAVQEINSEGVCNGSSKLMIITERIPLRLSQVSGLNFQDALSVIYSSFLGFQAIHNVQGYVSVTDQMIGFTPDYRVKVWLNENFSQNYPILPNRVINEQYSASAMIEEIIILVESHSAQSLLLDFRNYFYGRFSPTGNFADALVIVRDYAQVNGLTITNRVTFTQNVPRQIVKGQYTTSYVYPGVNQQLSLVRSTVIQQGQPTITTIQQPAVINYIQEPIIQQQLIHVNQPAIINQARIGQQLLIKQSATPQTSLIQAPITTIASPSPLINHRSLVQSTHFGIPSRVVTQNVQARNVVSHHPELSNINQTRLTSPLIQPFSQVRNNIQTINIKPVSLASRDITPPKVIPTRVQNQSPTRIQSITTTSNQLPIRNQSQARIIQAGQLQKGANLIQAERYISSLNQGNIRVSPQRIPANQTKPTAGSSPVVKIENLFKNKKENQEIVQGLVQTQKIQGNVVQIGGAGHHIGNTLKRYGQEGIVITTTQQIKPQSQGLIVQPQSQLITQPNNLLTNIPKAPTYIAPKVQITETRTVNIDGITTTNKVQQQQDIFTYQQPRTPINAIIPQTNTQKVTEDLQKAIKDIQITHQKKDDLIQYMKQHIEVTEDKNMTHSFGQQYNRYETSQNLLSRDVRDLLKNYDNKGETFTSGYAIDFKYKSTSQKVEDPIVVFNTDPYHRVETKGQIGASTSVYETYKQEVVTYSRSSDDYEALKAKYDIKYDSKRQTTNYGDNDFDKKYGGYKFDYRIQHKTEYKSSHDLGQSKYRKDYASNDNQDPLIVYNTKKVDIGARDSLGYKSSNRRDDDYDQYRKKLKSSNGYDAKNKYESKYETSNYRSHVSGDYDIYDSGYESKYKNKGNDKYGRQDHEDRYERNYRQEREDKYSSTHQPYRYEQSSKYERKSNIPRAQRYSNKYDTRYQRRVNNKQSRNDKKNISYHDLRSLLYD